MLAAAFDQPASGTLAQAEDHVHCLRIAGDGDALTAACGSRVSRDFRRAAQLHADSLRSFDRALYIFRQAWPNGLSGAWVVRFPCAFVTLLDESLDELSVIRTGRRWSRCRSNWS